MERVMEVGSWVLNGCVPAQHDEASDADKDQREQLDDADGVGEVVWEARVEGEEKDYDRVAGDGNAFLFPGSGRVSVDAEKVLCKDDGVGGAET